MRKANTAHQTMFGCGGDRRRMSIDPVPQLSSSSTAMIISESSVVNQVGDNSMGMVSSPDMQNGGKNQRAEWIAAHTKKLEDDLHEQGQKIKHHEENVNYLKTLNGKLDQSIHDLQVSMEFCDAASLFRTAEKDPDEVKSEKETIENIRKHENSAAALLWGMKSQAKVMSPDHSLTKDVIGLVATLGKVDNDKLSRLLSEYLGRETMLAVVCKTYEGVEALEAYDREGIIDKNIGIHACAASVGRPLTDRFLVICLEDIRPYAGKVTADDPQRRLALLKPRLPNGETPPGFLDSAVNMIYIDSTNLYCITEKGHNLRETLFYHLFSNLQVYKSREDMVKARPFINNGAISLDGGIIRTRGVFFLGHRQKDIEIKFPIVSKKLNIPQSYIEAEKTIKETKWKKNRSIEDMQREQELLNHAKHHFEIKKQELLQFMHVSSSHVNKQSAGSGSTPR